MPKKLAVLTAVLAMVLLCAPVPALAQEVPACEVQDACLDAPEEQKAADQQDTGSPEPAQTPSVPPAPEVECEGDSINPCLPNQGVPQTGNARNGDVPEAAFSAPASCGSCGTQVAQGALDAITGAGSDDTESTGAFDTALQAARGAGGTREAVASEEAEEDTPTYRAAFEAAKESGADDETAKEAARQAVAKADSGRAATDKAGKDRKERASKEDAGKGKDHKDKTREAGTDNEEETIDEEVAAPGEEDGGLGDNEVATTSAGNGAPLLLGGVALLSVGGYAALRVARSWSWSNVRRLLRI